jgi:hypothetical protein
VTGEVTDPLCIRDVGLAAWCRLDMPRVDNLSLEAPQPSITLAIGFQYAPVLSIATAQQL